MTLKKCALLLSAWLGLACQQTGEVTPAGAGGAAGASVNAGGAPGWGGAGGTGAGPGGSAGTPVGGGTGGPLVWPDAAVASDGPPVTMVDAGACPFSMAGTACAPAGASCSWSSECLARRCDCVAGSWACTERQMPCGGTCAAPQAARCGDPCTGNASGCLCRCGGGPNYASCSCNAGRWACGCGGN